MSIAVKEKTKSGKLTILASELLTQGDIEEGLEALKRSARIGDEKDMKTYLEIASNLYLQKDYEHAKIFIETFLEHYRAAEAYFILGAIESSIGNKDKAAKSYEAGIKIYNGMELAPYHECADLYIYLGDKYKASEMYKYILSKKENDKKSLLFLSSYYASMKNYKKACGCYQKLIDFGMAEYGDYQSYGLCLYEMGEYTKSEEMYILAMEKYPVKDKRTLELKNIRKRELKDSYSDIDKSENEYRKAVKENPNSSSYFHLGNIEFIKGNYNEAAKLYEQAKDYFMKHKS